MPGPIGLLAEVFKRIGNGISLGMRRMLTGGPTSITAEAEIAWLKEEVKVYATKQPFAGPLTTDDGGLSAGETWEMRRAYRNMALREPSVKSALLSKCLAVSQLKPVVMPASKRRPLDREAARWCDYSVSQSAGGWSELIQNILFPGLVDGFSVNEKVFDKLPLTHPDYPLFWTFKAAKNKDSRGVRFRLDEFRNVTAVQSMTGAQGGMMIDPGEFILFTHLKVFQNPFGVSDLRAANRAANLIENAIKLRSILLENFSGPFLVAKAGEPAARAKFRTILGQARARGWIVIPDTSELEVINLATSAPDQFQQTIKDLREEIVMAIQGAYLQLLEGGISDGRGNTEVHKGIAQLFQTWLAACVCQVIRHQLFGDLVRHNYGETVGLPLLQLGGVDSDTVSKALDKFKKGQELGLNLSKEQVYDESQLEIPETPEDTLKPPVQPQQQQPGAPQAGGNPFGFTDGGNGGAPIPGATFPAGDASADYAELVALTSGRVLGGR